VIQIIIEDTSLWTLFFRNRSHIPGLHWRSFLGVQHPCRQVRERRIKPPSWTKHVHVLCHWAITLSTIMDSFELYYVTHSFEAKIRYSSYVCTGSTCHTYGQNVNTENQCLKYINFITRILSLHRRLY
jgi:hypothetical protein